ncbi:MAG: sigma-70 family RNA polymerase sigma factor [Planctomycetota bacterium]
MADDPPHDADDPLVARAVAGDTEALEVLLRRYAPGICEGLPIDSRWSRSFDHEDILQVSSIEAILRIQSLRTPTVAGFKAWFHRTAENNARDAVRQLEARKRTPVERRVTHAPDGRSARTLLNALAGGGRSASKIVGGREEVTHLLEAIERLPATYRRVVQLFDLEERSVEQVAKEVGRSRGAVHMLHARAHERLRELLMRDSM